MRWDSRIARIERLEGQAPVDPDRERAIALEMLEYERKVLAHFEQEAARPFAERCKGVGPPASAERHYSDAAMAARIDKHRRNIARHEAELGIAPGN